MERLALFDTLSTAWLMLMLQSVLQRSAERASDYVRTTTCELTVADLHADPASCIL